jgi:hypothetical protein
LAISLSAIASGLILNEPSAIWAPMRATLSASKSALAPPESRVDAVLDSATVALASTVAAAEWAAAAECAAAAALPTSEACAAGVPACRACRRRVPAAACQRDVRSS